MDWRSWFGSFPTDMTVEVVGDHSGKPRIERIELSREIWMPIVREQEGKKGPEK